MLKDLKCKSGSYVEIVPLGILCTLQYNEAGILQKIITSYNETDYKDSDILDSAITIQLKKLNIVPQRIQFTKGTTWIKGVLYTKKLFKDEGTLPDCIKRSLMKDLIDNMKDYTFYAGHLKNDSYEFTGASLICTRLSTFGFNVLPGYTVYDNSEMIPVDRVLKEKNSPFAYPYISGVMIYESQLYWRYIPASLMQKMVRSTTNYLDEYGYIHTKVDFSKNGSDIIDVSYTNIVQYDVQPKAIVILDENNIINSRFKSKMSKIVHCRVCGKVMSVPPVGFTCCEDVHCPSRLYPIIKHFLSVLKLPEMSFDEYKSYVKNKEIIGLTDIFILDKYKNIEVECTLSNLLFAVVPIQLCRSVEFFQEFVNYSSVEAVDYYIQNPDAIVSDLNLNKIYSKNFAEWLKDPYNVVELETLISNTSNIKITSVERKFEGAPIFRGKNICLTGKFIHGTLEDVMSILQSYSARVTTHFDNSIDCVVVGHFEQEDRNITGLAESYSIPVYGEDEFFASYEIDKDIEGQLL